MLKTSPFALILLALMLGGCAEPTSTDTTAPTDAAGPDSGAAAVDNNDVDDSESNVDADSVAEDTSDLFGEDSETGEDVTQAADEGDSTQPSDEVADADGEEKPLETVEDFVNAINQQLQPPDQDVEAAIALAEQAHEKLPESEDLLRGLAALTYQSLQMPTEEGLRRDRQQRLGELGRLLVDRNKDNLETLGDMPGVLLLEAAKGLIAQQELDAAWETVKEARDFGFRQTALLFLDPAYEPLVNHPPAMAEIKQWLAEDVQEQIATNEPFPFDFSLKSLTDGQTISLADYAGKLVVVDFWGTWCPPCREEIPHFNSLAAEYGDQLAIVGINVEDPSGTPVPYESVKAAYDEFVQSQPIDYPCVAGDLETLDQVPDLQGFPTTLFIDGKGVVRLRLTGYHPLPMLKAAVEQLLKQPTT